jgi:hypothetical protein
VTEVNVVIGVDCATQENRVGLARAEREGKAWVLREATVGSRERPVADTVQEWLEQSSGKAVLALDAPLGWPAPWKSMLMGHQAGENVRGEPNKVFRRESDRSVASLVGKTPLDIGADRIARTAHWALSLLESLRTRIDQPIPLAWDISPQAMVSAIEVYPAATLRAYGLALKGYKAKGGVEERSRMLPAITDRIQIGIEPHDLLALPDAFDAAVCVLAALDFLAGRAMAPDDWKLSREEGWIWVAHPD